MAPAVVPVVAKIIEDERDDPHAPVTGGKGPWRPKQGDPLVKEKSEGAEENTHARADDAAAEAVDGIGQVVAARMTCPVDNQLQRDQKQKDRDCQRHGLSVKIIHTRIIALVLP